MFYQYRIFQPEIEEFLVLLDSEVYKTLEFMRPKIEVYEDFHVSLFKNESYYYEALRKQKDPVSPLYPNEPGDHLYST